MKSKATTEITFHSDSMMHVNAHPAVDVKVRSVPEPPKQYTEESRRRVYDQLTEEFWNEAQIIAHKHGFSGVFSEGRSSGWCVPFYQYQSGKLAQFTRWPGQGGSVGSPTEGYPIYPDCKLAAERKRFVAFRKEILDLIETLKSSYIELLAEDGEEERSA